MKKLYSILLSVLICTTVVSQVTKTANVTTPGTLSTVASSYLSTVTNLTVTGTIDWRDFNTLKSMSNLTILNLGTVNIVTYTDSGSNGTSIYPANEFYGLAYMATLTSIIMPNSVTSIWSGAFYGCNALTSITFPNSVTSIGNWAFMGTAWLNNQPNGILYIGKCVYQYKGIMPANTNITLQTGITQICQDAFNGSTGLTSITIPNSVTSIGVGAFQNCIGLTSIIIPSSFIKVEGSILDGCSNLLTIEAPADCFNLSTTAFPKLQSIKINSDTLKQSGVDIIKISYRTLKVLDLKYAQNTELLPDMLYNFYSLQSLILPNNLTSVTYHSISDCFSLTSINIPAIVTNIEMRAFENGRSIKKVTFSTGSQLKTIGNWAFYSCHALDTLSIPTGVTSIGDGAFWGCDYLKNVTIPSSVKTIGDNGFEGCKAIKIMNVAAIVPPALQTNTFNEVDKTIPVIVPAGSLVAYKAAPVWKDFINLRTTDPNELNQLQEISYNIYAKGRSIVVDNAANLNIRIFDLSGRKVAETIQASQNETINMPSTGVYLVRIGSKNTKVMVN